MTGSKATDVSFATTGIGDAGSVISGDLVVTGGKGDDAVRTNENLRINGNVRMSLGAGTT